MKYYKLESSYKKAITEIYTFKRPLNELTNDEKDIGKWAYLSKEMGWRWGEWLIEVPETDAEIAEWINASEYYNNIEDVADQHGFHIIDESNNIIVDPDMAPFQIMHKMLVPSIDEEYVDITEDYPDAEMICVDDCFWEDIWDIRTSGPKLSDVDKMIDEIEATYDEDYQEGIEALGWTFVENYFEMRCNPVITECDKNGNSLETSS